MADTSGSKPSRATVVGLGLTALTVIATLITALPGFLALQQRESLIVYELRTEHMVLPSDAEAPKVLDLLRRESLPTGISTLSISNRGETEAKQINISVRCPGDIVGLKMTPDDSQNPPWVRITRLGGSDSTTAAFNLGNMAVGPTLTIRVSFSATNPRDPEWEVFADGRPASRTAALVNFANRDKFRPFKNAAAWLAGGLAVSALVVMVLRARHNTALMNALFLVVRSIIPFPISQRSIERLDPSYGDWIVFRNAVLFELLTIPGTRIISASLGSFTTDDPEKFWDGIVEVETIKFGLAIFTLTQKFRGLTGSQPDYYNFVVKISEMAHRAHVLPVVVIDGPFWESDEGLGNAAAIDRLNAKATVRIERIAGNAVKVASTLVEIARKSVETTREPEAGRSSQ